MGAWPSSICAGMDVAMTLLLPISCHRHDRSPIPLSPNMQPRRPSSSTRWISRSTATSRSSRRWASRSNTPREYYVPRTDLYRWLTATKMIDWPAWQPACLPTPSQKRKKERRTTKTTNTLHIPSTDSRRLPTDTIHPPKHQTHHTKTTHPPTHPTHARMQQYPLPRRPHYGLGHPHEQAPRLPERHRRRCRRRRGGQAEGRCVLTRAHLSFLACV